MMLAMKAEQSKIDRTAQIKEQAMTTAMTLFGISLQNLKSEAEVKLKSLLELRSKIYSPERRKTPR